MTINPLAPQVPRLGLAILALTFVAACTSTGRSAGPARSATPATSVTGTYIWAPYAADSLVGCRLLAEQRGADSVRYDLECNRGAPSYNMGLSEGVLALKARNAVIGNAEFGGECMITFAFADSNVTVTQDGSDADCGFGFGVSAAPGGPTIYRKVSAAVPVFVEREK